MNALEYFMTHLKYEKNLKTKEVITKKCMEYLKEIRAILDSGGSGPAPSDDATITSQPKTKSKGGVGKDSEDLEQAKLRAGLDTAKWSDVAGLKSARQALQEDV
ncbi:protein SUPPRESSOR OF K(+) TRANSPORT GROWTH DEFECT 1-like [Quercus lobata]|nr:protein SUPPRESSOR OF K(+) TRANSPORT GROWTH DEFECT 1-like [Quercus lobata]